MAFRTSFKPGIKQSLMASRYFQSVADEMMLAFLPNMTGRQYLVQLRDKKSLPVRVWSVTDVMENQVEEILAWLLSVHQDIRSLHDAADPGEQVTQVVERWSHSRLNGSTFFIEQMDPSIAFTSEHEPDLTLGVVGGHTVMVSSNTLMYVGLEEGMYGLSMARHGSYLLETDGHEGVEALNKRQG